MWRNIRLNINGKPYDMDVDVGESLVETLRTRMGLTGAKIGCGVGECGACTLLVDGESIVSCIYLTVWADGKSVETIEGQRIGDELSPVQQAFIEENAIQCGFCTPGFIMSAQALLKENPHPNREEIRRGLSGNLCRCTGYKNIIRAVEKAAETLEPLG